MKALVRTSRPRRRVLAVAGAMLAACLVPASSTPQPSAAKPNDLDAFMARVLERRDENWRRLHDYILSETETFSIDSSGRLPLPGDEAGDFPLSGFRREYMWYVRDGFLIRSPVRYDGVKLSERERRAYEDRWMKEEQAREKKAQTAAAKKPPAPGAGSSPADSPSLRPLVGPRGEPRFVSEAYFLKFKFEPGHYYLVGRETFEGRTVLKIEYYPRELFRDEKAEGGGRGAKGGKADDPGQKGAAVKPAKPKQTKQPSEDAEDRKIERDMNKVALVTLWVEPTEHQIVKYTFDNIDFGFLPGRWLVRVDDIRASMTMSRVLDGAWLPGRISVHAGLTFATGHYGIRYERSFYDYKKAEVGARIRILPPKRP